MWGGNKYLRSMTDRPTDRHPWLRLELRSITKGILSPPFGGRSGGLSVTSSTYRGPKASRGEDR